MTPPATTVPHLADPAATARFARALAPGLAGGGLVALDGPLGAGKSDLARGIIRYFAGEPTEVPSPTYTLVQAYETPRIEILHADLYRLGDPAELEELGIPEALDAGALVLCEWAARADGRLGPPVLSIAIEPAGDGRALRLSGPLAARAEGILAADA